MKRSSEVFCFSLLLFLQDTDILNTAVLTGKKVVMPLRIVAVEEDGVVTDVSDYTDCSSTDEDILKVPFRHTHTHIETLQREQTSNISLLAALDPQFLLQSLGWEYKWLLFISHRTIFYIRSFSEWGHTDNKRVRGGNCFDFLTTCNSTVVTFLG